MPRTSSARIPKRGQPTPAAKLPPWHRQLIENLRALIRASGQSQAAFAEKCDIDAPRISDWLAGKQRPSLTNLQQIGERLGVSIDWLLFDRTASGPVFRSQARRQTELEVDLEHAIARIANEMEPGSSRRVPPSGKDTIRSAAQELVEEYRYLKAAEIDSRDAIGRDAQAVGDGLVRDTDAGAAGATALSRLVQRARSAARVSADASRQLRAAKKHLDVARVALEQIDQRQAWTGRLDTGRPDTD